MGLISIQGEWVPVQVKVFSRWFAAQLKDKVNIDFHDITKDLKNGVALIELAKILTCKETPRKWSYQPKNNIDMVQNCDLALDMFTKDGVRFIGISGRDINENNEKLILGLVWSIIFHYSIGNDKNSKASLLSWEIERTENYSNVQNFAPYELTLLALLDSYVPEKINYSSINPDDFDYNSQLAIDVMNELGIPIFIYPEDVKNQESKFDQQILLTQLAAAKNVLENLQQKQLDCKIKERSIDLIEELSNDDSEEIEIEDNEKQESSVLNDLAIKNEEIASVEKEINNINFYDMKDTLTILFVIIIMLFLAIIEFNLI